MAVEVRRRVAGPLRGRLARVLPGSVRVRTTIAAVVVVGVTLLLGAAGLVLSLRSAQLHELRASAMVRAVQAARTVDAGGDPTTAVAADADIVLQVLSSSGAVLRATPNATGAPPLASLAAGESRQVAVPFDDDKFLVVSAAAGGDRMVLVGESLDAVDGVTTNLIVLLMVGLPAVLLVAGATSWRVVGRALAPVDAIRREVDAISASRLNRRVPTPPADDEVGRLATTMNRMLDRLEHSHVRQRQFVADAAHELRSPIATIRQHCEVAIGHPSLAGGLAQTVHAESLRMQALVDDLLVLAAGDEAMLAARRAPVDLDDLVLDEARRLRSTGVKVDSSGVGAVRIHGDAKALRRVLQNVGDNAARHARERIALSLASQDGWAQLSIDDDGPGVPVEDRIRIFERFVRLDSARARSAGGSGLGLAIVAEVVGAHGGFAALGESRLGGARVTVRLPAIDSGYTPDS